MFLTLLGCQEYQLIGPKLGVGEWPVGAASAPDTDVFDYTGALDDLGMVALPDPIPTEVEAEASINLRFEYGDFGERVSACSAEVAFYTISEDDGYGDGNTAGTITQPEDAGTCAFTALTDTSGSGGSLSVRGSVDAGESLRMWGAARLDLPRQESGDALTYSTNCSAETYPFGHTLSLSGNGVAGGIGTFTLHDVVAVTPDIRQTAPTDADLDAGILPQSVSEPMDWGWEWTGPFPTTADGPAETSQMFYIRNMRRDDNAIFEAIACMPDEDGWLTVPAEMMSLLTPDPGDDSLYASAQLDTYVYGVEGDAPWGETVRVQSKVVLSGLVRLTP